jgi:NDP-sugar pyrophosphorylase family protein
MILAAGYGARLRPITCTLPKPMVPLGGKPLIAWLVESLLRAGVRDIIVNLHHLPETIESYLPAQFVDARFSFSFEPKILGTAGGVRKVSALLERQDDFFLLNGDTFQLPPYDGLRRGRRERDSLSALTLRHPPAGDSYTAVWQQDGVVTGYGKGRGQSLMFSGSHCVSSRVFRYIPDRDVSDMTTDVYQPLISAGRETIAAVVDDNPLWFDIGTPRRYLAASRALGDMIGNSIIEGGVIDSVIWDDCFIGRGVTLKSCIVAHGVEIRTPMQIENAVICRDDPAIPRDASYQFEKGLVIAYI